MFSSGDEEKHKILTTAYVGMGSNIEPRLEYLRRAAREMKKAPLSLVQLSSVYETEPVGHKDQASFLNAVAVIQTSLSAEAMLARLQQMESDAGKEVAFPSGPRTLDLDLLMFGAEIMNTPGLSLPHPRMASRGFVLIPLCEINPGLRHPVGGQTMGELLFHIPKPSPRVDWWGALGVSTD